MASYLSCLISISVIIGVCSYVSYGENRDGYLKTASSLILVYMIISPIVGIVKEVADIVDLGDSLQELPESIENTEIAQNAEAAFCAGIKKHVCQNFSISEEDVAVKSFGFDFEKMKAEKIKILLSGKAIFADNRAIASEITGSGLGECEVELSAN